MMRSLPDELLLYIVELSMLPPAGTFHNVLSLSATCSRLLSVGRDDRIWSILWRRCMTPEGRMLVPAMGADPELEAIFPIRRGDPIRLVIDVPRGLRAPNSPVYASLARNFAWFFESKFLQGERPLHMYMASHFWTNRRRYAEGMRAMQSHDPAVAVLKADDDEEEKIVVVAAPEDTLLARFTRETSELGEMLRRVKR